MTAKEKYFVSFKRVLRLGWRNFFREGGLSLVAVFVLTVTIVLISSLFLLRGIAELLVEDIEQKADITIDFQIGVGEDQIFSIKESIVKSFDLNDMEYISRDEAQRRFIQRHGDRPLVMEALEEVGNPFPASLNIRAGDMYVYRQITDYLESEHHDSIYNIDFFQREVVISRIFSITETMRRAGIIGSIILAIIAVLLVHNTTKLAIYGLREEIKVMRLVGSSNYFIQGSFIVQGLIMGAIAGAVSFLLFLLIFALFFREPGVILDINLREYLLENMAAVLLLQFGLALFLGVLSSLVSTRRHLKN